MVIAYDQQARSRQLFIDEARKKEEAEKQRITTEMNAIMAELDAMKKSELETMKHLHRLELEKKKDEERLASLEKDLSDLRASHEEEIERAVASARRTGAAEAQGQMNRAFELFSKMMGKPMTSLLHYSQAISNLQILDDMVDPNEDFDPVAERAHIEEMKAKLGRADDEFDEMAVQLKRMLGKDYHLSINVGDLDCSPLLEVTAKSVGVFTASGSNDGSMGLRMRGSSEEDSDEKAEGEMNLVGEAAITKEVVALVVPQSQQVVTDSTADPVAEKPSHEAASSTAPVIQEEQDKELGEI